MDGINSLFPSNFSSPRPLEIQISTLKIYIFLNASAVCSPTPLFSLPLISGCRPFLVTQWLGKGNSYRTNCALSCLRRKTRSCSRHWTKLERTSPAPPSMLILFVFVQISKPTKTTRIFSILYICKSKKKCKAEIGLNVEFTMINSIIPKLQDKKLYYEQS